MNPRRLPAFAPFYRAQFPGFVQQHRAFARSGITLVQAQQAPHATEIPGTGEWRITESLSPKPFLRRRIDGQWQEGQKPSGSFSLAPPGLAIPVEVTEPYMVRALVIESARLEAQFCSVGAPGAAPLTPLLKTLALRDPNIESLLQRFWAEAETRDPVARLLAEGMTATLAGCLLRLAGYRAQEPSPLALAPRRLRRALDLIEARLSEDIGLDDLAEAAGLSPYHFSRAFRAATGMPPYRYLTHQRIARAKRLMEETELGLAQAAFECGFGSQGQFTTTFTRLVGISPGRWRAERKR